MDNPRMQFMTLFVHLGYHVKIIIRARVLENTHKKDKMKFWCKTHAQWNLPTWNRCIMFSAAVILPAVMQKMTEITLIMIHLAIRQLKVLGTGLDF